MASLTLDFPEDFIVDLKTIQKLKADFDETSEKLIESDFDISIEEIKKILQIYALEYEKAGKLRAKEEDNLNIFTISSTIISLREAILAMMVFAYSKMTKKMEDENAQSKKTLDVVIQNITKMIKKYPEEYTEVLDELGLKYVGGTKEFEPKKNKTTKKN